MGRKSSSASAPTPNRNAIQFSQKGQPMFWTHATSEIAMGTKLGIDATRNLAGEEFKKPWPPLIKMDEAVKRRMADLFGG